MRQRRSLSLCEAQGEFFITGSLQWDTKSREDSLVLWKIDGAIKSDGMYEPMVKQEMVWRRPPGNFTIEQGKKSIGGRDDPRRNETEVWYADRLLLLGPSAGVDLPRVMWIEFVASSDERRKLHFVALTEVPAVVRDVSSMMGRVTKGTDGVWRPSTGNGGGRTRVPTAHSTIKQASQA